MRHFIWAVVAAGLVVTTPAAAQDTPSGVNSPERYVAVPTKVGDRPMTLLVDTVFGRTWTLVRSEAGGFVWRRVFFEEQGDGPPDGLERAPRRLTK